METLKLKTIIAGMFGSGQGWAAFFYSQECGVLLGNILKAVSIIIAILSGIYIIRIHQHRNAIKSIEEARAEGSYCQPCRVGKEPEFCPISVEHRPSFCPKTRRQVHVRKVTLRSRLASLKAWRKKQGLIFKDDTTTK